MFDDDITRGKHGGSATSTAANQIASRHRREKLDQIVAWARARGEAGVTCYDVVDHFGWLLQTVSGLLTRLKADGRLVELVHTEARIKGEDRVVRHTRPSPTGAPCQVLVTPEVYRTFKIGRVKLW